MPDIDADLRATIGVMRKGRKAWMEAAATAITTADDLVALPRCKLVQFLDQPVVGFPRLAGHVYVGVNLWEIEGTV